MDGIIKKIAYLRHKITKLAVSNQYTMILIYYYSLHFSASYSLLYGYAALDFSPCYK